MDSKLSTPLLEQVSLSSPFGPLQAALFRGKLCHLSWQQSKDLTGWAQAHRFNLKKISKAPLKLQREMDRYFQGRLKKFQFPTVFLSGTAFEKKVWNTLKKIPYGDVRSYQWVANKIGKPKAVRAVGQANGKNCLPIVIPCHRVISSGGGLGGYSGGVGMKKKLLELEGVEM